MRRVAGSLRVLAGLSLLLVTAALGPRPLAAQAAAPAGGDDVTELAKKTQNPVADLISVPFQNDLNFGAGTNDATIYVLNVQPVIPFKLTEDWNVITRTIVPIVNQPSLFPGGESAFGLGDVNPTLFLSPARPGRLIWGLGPTFTLPTATSSVLGSGKWSAGPAAVALTIHGPWVLGALANHQWSFAGQDSRPDVSLTLIQPFVNYNFHGGWYLVTAPIITADWEADADNRWTVPLGGGAGRLFRVGKLPVNAQVQAFANVVRPDNAPDWQLRLQVQFLFPK